MAAQLEQVVNDEIAGFAISYPGLDPEEANSRLASMDPEERIKWAYQEFGKRIVVSTSGKSTSPVVLDILQRAIDYSVFWPPVYFVDTGLPDEQRNMQIAKLMEYGHNIIILNPRYNPEQLDKMLPGWRTKGSDDYERANELLKLDPFNEALRALDPKPKIWIRGAFGNGKREHMRESGTFLEYRNGLLRLYPLIDKDTVWGLDYMRRKKIEIIIGNPDFFHSPYHNGACSLDRGGGITAN